MNPFAYYFLLLFLRTLLLCGIIKRRSEYETKAGFCRSVFSSLLPLNLKLKICIYYLLDESSLQEWRENLPLSGPCSYMNVKNNSNVFACWNEQKLGFCDKVFKIDKNMISQNSALLNKGRFLYNNNKVPLGNGYYQFDISLKRNDNCGGEINLMYYNKEQQNQQEIEVKKKKEEKWIFWHNIMKNTPSSSTQQNKENKELKPNSVKLNFLDSNEGVSHNEVKASLILNDKEIDRLNKIIPILAIVGAPVIDSFIGEFDKMPIFHCDTFERFIRRVLLKEEIYIGVRSESLEHIIGLVENPTSLFTSLSFFVKLIMDPRERIFVQKLMRYNKEKVFGAKTGGYNDQDGPCDWKTGKLRYTKIGEKFLMDKICNVTSSQIMEVKGLYNLERYLVNPSMKHVFVIGECKVILEPAEIIPSDHMVVAKIRSKVFWYDNDKNLLIDSCEGVMNVSEYNRMLNVFHFMRTNQISGFIERKYKVLKINTIHLKTPIRIFKDFESGHSCLIFHADSNAEIFVGSIKIELNRNIELMNVLSSNFDIETVKTLILYHFFFLKRMDFEKIFKLIPGAPFTKNMRDGFSNTQFKRYSSDISRIYSTRGYKPLKLIEFYPKTQALEKAFELSGSASIDYLDIGRIKIDENDIHVDTEEHNNLLTNFGDSDLKRDFFESKRKTRESCAYEQNLDSIARTCVNEIKSEVKDLNHLYSDIEARLKEMVVEPPPVDIVGIRMRKESAPKSEAVEKLEKSKNKVNNDISKAKIQEKIEKEIETETLKLIQREERTRETELLNRALENKKSESLYMRDLIRLVGETEREKDILDLISGLWEKQMSLEPKLNRQREILKRLTSDPHGSVDQSRVESRIERNKKSLEDLEGKFNKVNSKRINAIEIFKRFRPGLFNPLNVDESDLIEFTNDKLILNNESVIHPWIEEKRKIMNSDVFYTARCSRLFNQLGDQLNISREKVSNIPKFDYNGIEMFLKNKGPYFKIQIESLVNSRIIYKDCLEPSEDRFKLLMTVINKEILRFKKYNKNRVFVDSVKSQGLEVLGGNDMTHLIEEKIKLSKTNKKKSKNKSDRAESNVMAELNDDNDKNPLLINVQKNNKKEKEGEISKKNKTDHDKLREEKEKGGKRGKKKKKGEKKSGGLTLETVCRDPLELAKDIIINCFKEKYLTKGRIKEYSKVQEQKRNENKNKTESGDKKKKLKAVKSYVKPQEIKEMGARIIRKYHAGHTDDSHFVPIFSPLSKTAIKGKEDLSKNPDENSKETEFSKFFENLLISRRIKKDKISPEALDKLMQKEKIKWEKNENKGKSGPISKVVDENKKGSVSFSRGIREREIERGDKGPQEEKVYEDLTKRIYDRLNDTPELVKEIEILYMRKRKMEGIMGSL